MRKRFLIFLVLPLLLFSEGKVFYSQINESVIPPWLTGPLIAPTAHVVPLGHYNIEPYIFAAAFTGTYSSEWDVVKFPTFWNSFLQVPTMIGLASWLDVLITPTVNWNYSQHQAAWTVGDLLFGFDAQLYHSTQNSWAPFVKLTLKEILPIGKYRNLNPKKLYTDEGGEGSWMTGLGLVIGNLYHIKSVYYFNYRLALNYFLPAPVHLKGFNFYGGGYGTDLRFFPASNFEADLGIEVTLAQTWALALDVIGYWSGKGHYTGKRRGVDASGKPASLNARWLRSQAQFSLAPAIEYNWNENIGVIAGAWFSFAGRNTLAFTSGVIAVNYYK